MAIEMADWVTEWITVVAPSIVLLENVPIMEQARRELATTVAKRGKPGLLRRHYGIIVLMFTCRHNKADCPQPPLCRNCGKDGYAMA